MPTSVFAADHDKVWSYRYQCTLHIFHMSGGVPSNPKVITGWLTSRLLGKDGRDVELANMVAKTALERGVSDDKAIEEVAANLNINGFKRDKDGLVYEGRCAKAAIKEYFSIALGGGHIPKGNSWGATNKGMQGFVAEHVQVPEEFIALSRPDDTRYTEPDDVEQRFVSTWRGQGISYTEMLEEATMSFVVEADWDFDKFWPTIWTIGEKNGIGAMRSQGSGKFVTVEWTRLEDRKSRRVRRTA